MAKIKAFVGHSFNQEDKEVVAAFLNYFDSLKDIGLEWEHAERAVATKAIDDKIVAMMEGKNLFIGIFTRKRKQIEQTHLTQCFWNKQKVKASADKYSWTTSDWVIQESGYALGKGMDIIFITEEGIEPVGGLQGNLQYIQFNRENTSKSFSKLNESITSLLATSVIGTQKETKETPPDEFDKSSESDKKESKKSTPFVKLLRAIMEGNEEEEKTAFEEMLGNDSDNYKQVETKGIYYWLKYKYGNKDVWEDIVKLSKENTDHPDPHYRLGTLYQEYKQFDKAYEQFIEASKLSKTDIDKTKHICKAAAMLIEENEFIDAIKLLIERIATIDSTAQDELFDAYRTLAEVQKRAKNIEQYFSLTEKVLELNPADKESRFSLAYAYSENKNHIMALYHYQILCDSTPDSANWNNLGVELSELGVVGKSVEAYIKSKESGGTYAVGNMAYKLIEAGFYYEAGKQLQEAVKQDNCASNVITALSSLKDKLKQENQKELEIVSDVPSIIKFRVKYSEAYTRTRDDTLLLQKIWSSKHGNVEIKVDSNKFVATGTSEVPKTTLGDLYPYGIGSVPKSKGGNDIKVITYEGVITNGIIDYKLSITIKSSESANDLAKSTKASTILGALADRGENTEKYYGQMIISQDNNKI